MDGGKLTFPLRVATLARQLPKSVGRILQEGSDVRCWAPGGVPGGDGFTKTESCNLGYAGMSLLDRRSHLDE